MSGSAAADTVGDGWVRVAATHDVTPGTLRGAAVPGTKLVLALVNVDGELLAVDSTCPHREGPLANGRLVQGEVECPWHRFRFDPRSGRGTVPDAFAPLARYPVRVVDEDIEVLPVPLGGPATAGDVNAEGATAAADAAPAQQAAAQSQSESGATRGDPVELVHGA